MVMIVIIIMTINIIATTIIIIIIITDTYVTDVGTPNRQNLYNTITENLQVFTDLKEGCIRMWKIKRAFIIPLALSATGIILKTYTNV
jgi:hypothetical protein